MCGITILFKNRLGARYANNILAHRGVRSTVWCENPYFSVGHVRLPIQGIQPEFDPPIRYKHLMGAFVGEIYNFKDYIPTSESDLFVLLKAWEQLDYKCLEGMFDGSWSGIIYDGEEKGVSIFTDYLGKKPLYYLIKCNEIFGVSSEIKVLELLFDPPVNQTHHAAIRKWGYDPTGQTGFEGVYRLPPNTCLKLDPYGRISEWICMKPLTPRRLDLRRELSKAVENRLISDVPISLLMSGGLDSTIIYYLMREFVDNITIFHVENGEAEFLKYIDFRPYDKVITLDITRGVSTDKIFYHNDGLTDLGSVIPQYYLGQAIRNQGYNVCLSGDGADELFGGYKRAKKYDSQYSDIFHEVVHYHLPRLDKMMFAHRVEIRCPFLSRRVIEHALSLPHSRRTMKEELKDTFQDLVPVEILNRTKKPLRDAEWKSKEEVGL